MANGIQTTLVGNLTADPELKFSESGNAQLNFSLACERSYMKDGEWVNEVSFPDIIAWRQTGEDAAGVLEKGVRTVVTGRFEQRFWEDKESGQKRSKWQFVADVIAVDTKVIESMTRKRRNADESGGNQRSNNNPSSSRRPAAARPAARTSSNEEW